MVPFEIIMIEIFQTTIEQALEVLDLRSYPLLRVNHRNLTDESELTLNCSAYLAYFDNELAGYAIPNLAHEYMFLIEVLPRYRGKGIGTALCFDTGIYYPEVDINPGFWSKMRRKQPKVL